MIKRNRVWTFLAVGTVFLAASAFAAQTATAPANQIIKLPPPQTEGGKPLMQVLKDRQSNRAFKPDKLPLQVLSNLLWAGDGVNRPDGKRTAPSAMNVQNIEVYVAMADGLYVYDAPGNALKLVIAEDLRGMTGMQDFAKTVPVDLVYVADLSKLQRAPEETRMVWSAAHAGFIGQNVYLFCASEGLSTVVRGSFDKDALAKAFKLGPDQRPILAQSIGYPAKQNGPSAR